MNLFPACEIWKAFWWITRAIVCVCAREKVDQLVVDVNVSSMKSFCWLTDRTCLNLAQRAKTLPLSATYDIIWQDLATNWSQSEKGMSCEGTQLRHPSHSRFCLCNEFTKRPHTITYPCILCILFILISSHFFFYMWHWHILTPKCRSDSNPWGIFMDGLPLDVSLGPSTGTVWEKMTQFMMINRLSACSGKEHLEIVDMNLLCAYLWRPMTCFMSFLPLFWCKLTFMFSFRKQTLVLSCIVLWLR